MPFDPASLLTLKYSERSIVVPRNLCCGYGATIAAAQRNFQSLQSISKEDLILKASIPNYPDKREIELSKEAWPLVYTVVQCVTVGLKSGSAAAIAYESGASPGGLPPSPDNPVAAAIDQTVLLLGNRVAGSKTAV